MWIAFEQFFVRDIGSLAAGGVFFAASWGLVRLFGALRTEGAS